VRLRRAATIAALLALAGGCGGSGEGPGAGRGLPLIEVPSQAASSGMFAILLTGDGGWSSFDRGLSARLAARGIPVVGWSSLRYLWRRKDADSAAADLAAVIETYAAAWKRERVALLGFSLGADALPAMAARLPPEARGRVAMIGLLSPETRYELEFHFSGWIPGFPARGRPLLPEVRKLRGARLVCVYGAGEKDSLCPELDTAWAEVRVFPGGHHLGRDYGALADALFPPPASP
jgi:type IV secretory pathway VirJ component